VRNLVYNCFISDDSLKIFLDNYQVAVNPYLEEWFLSDPIEKLTTLENALITKLKKNDEVS